MSSIFLLSILCVLLFESAVLCQRYIVPEATLEFLSPRGLKISIPDIDDAVTLVAFHININNEFYGLEHGQWGQDILKKREGRWSYYIPDFKVKQGDTIYYWIYVIVDRLGYHGLDRVYKVTQSNPHDTNTQPAPSTPEKPEFTPDRGNEGNGGEICRPSYSSRNGGLSACRGVVILDEKFSNLDRWSHVVQIGGRKPEDEFTVFTKDPASLQDGNLVIKPVLLEEKFDVNCVTNGSYVLDGCTSNEPEECRKQAATYLIQPPVMSARLTTRGHFSFRYGTLEIRAKLPKGDWIVPELWLEPVSSDYGSHAGKVVLGLSRGNTDFTIADVSNWLLEMGALVNQSSYLGKKTSDIRWSQDYHTFKLFWNQDEMVFSVDNQAIARLPSGDESLDPSLKSGKLAPFDKEFYITLGVHVAGTRDFPTEVQKKPWKNSDTKRLLRFWQARNTWHATWNQDSALRVQSVKVTAL